MSAQSLYSLLPFPELLKTKASLLHVAGLGGSGFVCRKGTCANEFIELGIWIACCGMRSGCSG